MYKDRSGKNKLEIWNLSKNYYTYQKLPKIWRFSQEIHASNLETRIDSSNSLPTSSLVLTQLDGSGGKEIVGVGRSTSSGNAHLFVISYGNYSPSRVTTYTYQPGTNSSVAGEFFIHDMDGLNGKRKGVRSAFDSCFIQGIGEGKGN